jgi:hypothetical protein
MMFFVDCIRCGRFKISHTLLAIITAARSEHVGLLPFLSAHTRQASERREVVSLLTDNWEAMARGHQHTGVRAKLRMVLEYLARNTKRPGDQVQPNWNDEYPLFDALNSDEILFFLETLESQGFIDGASPNLVRVTAKGWEQLEPNVAGGEPGTCFLAMAFAPEMNEAYNSGFVPAIDDCGLRLVRVDKVEHNGVVTDLIQASIRGAQVIVADVTLQRNGVYFEAGFAMGLGRIVVWTCREDDLEHVHFDTNHYNHVVWNSPSDLRDKLKNRLRATVAVPKALD